MKIYLKKFRRAHHLNQIELAELFNCTQANISYMENTDRDLEGYQYDKLVEKYGKEEVEKYVIPETPFQAATAINSPGAVIQSTNVQIAPQTGSDEATEADSVPVLPVSLKKVRDLDLYEYVKNNDVPEEQPIAQFPKCDLYYQVTGDSMLPDLKPADMLGLRRVPREGIIMNGHAYVVDTCSNGIFACNLHDTGGEEFICRFNNTERYGEFTIRKSDVINVFEAVGMYRLNV